MSERQLSDWLLERISAIREQYAEVVEQHYEPEERQKNVSAYFVLSFVLKPHIEALLDAGHEKELQHILILLEHLANYGDSSVRETLRVIMEEVDVWRVWKFLGETMRHNTFEEITWFPELEDRNTPANTHVDKVRYQQRWREEIARIGGFENLIVANQLYIRYKLVQEFGISGLRAPRPGGEEWLSMGLPWPWPQGKETA